MKIATFISVALIFVAAANASQQIESFQGAIRQLNEVEPSSEEDYLRISEEAINAWNSLDSESQNALASDFYLVHYHRAKIFQKRGRTSDAVAELIAEGRLQQSTEGRLEFSTKLPDVFFRDLVVLQAELTEASSANPLSTLVNYSFQPIGTDYRASRIELFNDIHGISVELDQDGRGIIDLDVGGS